MMTVKKNPRHTEPSIRCLGFFCFAFYTAQTVIF